MIKDAYPVPYAYWYAAALFINAGHGPEEVLTRLGIDDGVWDSTNRFYGMLHFANMSWVASALRRDGLPDPARNTDLYAHLCEGGGIHPPVQQPFALRPQLSAIRKVVEADPHIGPFAKTSWRAHYIAERAFPTLRYMHDGHRVLAGGMPLAGRTGKPIDGVDPVSFRQLGQRWFRDRDRVYAQGAIRQKPYWYVVRHADPATFRVLNERHAYDANAGYYITNKRFPTADPGTFEVIAYHYGRGQKPGLHHDESHWAKDGRKVYGYGVEVPDAHAPSFSSIGDEGKYFADRARIYWERDPIAGADRESFVCASEAGQYRAYDKDRPYWAGKPQSVTAEFDRWRAFFEAHSELTDTWWHRERDRRASGESEATEAAPTKSLGGPFFSDGKRVLVRPRRSHDGRWVTLDYLDHDSFRPIVDVFGVDKHGLRYFNPGLESFGTDPVKDSDPESFRALGDDWYRDDGQIYYMALDSHHPQLVCTAADPASFEVLGGVYGRDADALFVGGVRKRNIDDPGAVVALGGDYARIGDTILRNGKPVKNPGAIDIATARGLPGVRLLLDAKGNLLLGGRYRKPLPGFDAASFRFLNQSFAVDHDQVYALTEAALSICEDIDRATVESDGPMSVRDCNARFVADYDKVTRRPLAD
ncbi:DKNYY domain-containing protein [Thalassococcus sp. S3]|uniref:DKNYY domain-containing protein n=1 Tax=Thalassococcus sp. S3 TaxID=2017482 RepID=UPI0010242585|nr:DKNYY domain-containing protein [Thalassococcus sp. S3]QBF29884.1 hypothetical protein CFI11_01445 [Thalassococcus sp. S3]